MEATVIALVMLLVIVVGRTIALFTLVPSESGVSFWTIATLKVI